MWESDFQPHEVKRLTRDLFLEGDFYPGDLLAAVLRAERGFWLHAPADFAVANELAGRALKELPTLKTTVATPTL